MTIRSQPFAAIRTCELPDVGLEKGNAQLGACGRESGRSFAWITRILAGARINCWFYPFEFLRIIDL